MKLLVSVAQVIFLIVLLSSSTAGAGDLEPIVKLSAQGGAEREEGADAGGRGTIEALGIFPMGDSFGLQGMGHYVGGRGSRYGLSLGPILSWNTGKAGVLVNYQHRTLRDNNFAWIRPSVSLYLDQANLNLWYSQPVSTPQRSPGRVEYGISQIQGTFHYFPPADVTSFMRKDNLEFTFGVQANTFAGAGRSELEGAGVGPVWGLAFMPSQSLVVNLFRATMDNRSRYRVESGLQFFFNGGDQTLKELRRKYLEPNLDAPGNIGVATRRGAPPLDQDTTPPPPPST